MKKTIEKHPFKIQKGGKAVTEKKPVKRYTGQDNFREELRNQIRRRYMAQFDAAIDKREEAKRLL